MNAKEIYEEPDNLVIRDKARAFLRASLVERITQMNKALKVDLVEGISYECYITYVAHRFPNCETAREANEGESIRYDLLEAISDEIELTLEDARKMEGAERRWREEVERNEGESL